MEKDPSVYGILSSIAGTVP